MDSKTNVENFKVTKSTTQGMVPNTDSQTQIADARLVYPSRFKNIVIQILIKLVVD